MPKDNFQLCFQVLSKPFKNRDTRTCVVGRAEDSDVNIRPVRHPLGDGVGPEAAPLNVHVVRLLGLALGGKVHEDRGRVQLEGLEDVRPLVKVHHGEEERVGVELGVAVGVRHNVKLIAVFRRLNSLPGTQTQASIDLHMKN